MYQYNCSHVNDENSQRGIEPLAQHVPPLFENQVCTSLGISSSASFRLNRVLWLHDLLISDLQFYLHNIPPKDVYINPWHTVERCKMCTKKTFSYRFLFFNLTKAFSLPRPPSTAATLVSTIAWATGSVQVHKQVRLHRTGPLISISAYDFTRVYKLKVLSHICRRQRMLPGLPGISKRHKSSWTGVSQNMSFYHNIVSTLPPGLNVFQNCVRKVHSCDIAANLLCSLPTLLHFREQLDTLQS